MLKKTPASPAKVIASAAAPTDEVIDFERLCALLAQHDGTPVDRRKTSDGPWHVDFARKTYLRALIRYFKGNLRKIASHWDRESEGGARTNA
jgi:hypothetical protein